MITALIVAGVLLLVVVFVVLRQAGMLCWLGIHSWVKRTIMGPSGRPVTVKVCQNCGKEKKV